MFLLDTLGVGDELRGTLSTVHVPSESDIESWLLKWPLCIKKIKSSKKTYLLQILLDCGHKTWARHVFPSYITWRSGIKHATRNLLLWLISLAYTLSVNLNDITQPKTKKKIILLLLTWYNISIDLSLLYWLVTKII